MSRFNVIGIQVKLVENVIGMQVKLVEVILTNGTQNMFKPKYIKAHN